MIHRSTNGKSIKKSELIENVTAKKALHFMKAQTLCWFAAKSGISHLDCRFP